MEKEYHSQCKNITYNNQRHMAFFISWYQTIYIVHERNKKEKIQQENPRTDQQTINLNLVI